MNEWNQRCAVVNIRLGLWAKHRGIKWEKKTHLYQQFDTKKGTMHCANWVNLNAIKLICKGKALWGRRTMFSPADQSWMGDYLTGGRVHPLWLGSVCVCVCVCVLLLYNNLCMSSLCVCCFVSRRSLPCLIFSSAASVELWGSGRVSSPSQSVANLPPLTNLLRCPPPPSFPPPPHLIHSQNDLQWKSSSFGSSIHDNNDPANMEAQWRSWKNVLTNQVEKSYNRWTSYFALIKSY